MSKPKYMNFSKQQMEQFVAKASSFEEVLEQMHYSKTNDSRIIESIRGYCDTLQIAHEHLPNISNPDLIKCNCCGQIKPKEEYYFSKGQLAQKVCKICVRAKQNAKYHSKQDWINQYKQEHHCVKCGCEKSYLLDFHHLDPSQKDYTISDNSNIKIETLMQEIEKCIILCANCHREFHYFERTNNLTIQEYLNGVME